MQARRRISTDSRFPHEDVSTTAIDNLGRVLPSLSSHSAAPASTKEGTVKVGSLRANRRPYARAMKKIRASRRHLPAAAVAVGAVIVALLAPAGAEATFPGANGPIAYEAPAKIGVVDPATGATDEAVSSGFGPAFFPGSRRLAYIRVVGFEDPRYRNLRKTSIYVKSLQPDHPRAPGRRITGQRAFSVRDLAVTPDGRRIVFVAAHPIGYHEPEFDIWSISTRGTGLRRLTNNGVFDNDVDVSPDGRRIAYAEKVNGRAQVFLMDIDGSNQHRLTFDGRRDRAPHWSPDGRRIVYFSAPGKGGRAQGDEDVWSIAAAGGRPRHLASNAGEEPVYSPDGRQIAFLRNYSIWLMRANGSHQRRLLGSKLGLEITSLDWGGG